MRPHKLKEFLMNNSDESKILLETLEDIPSIFNFLNPCFEFGDISKISLEVIDNIYSYVFDLVNNDMYHTPFKNCTVSFRDCKSGVDSTVFLEEVEKGIAIGSVVVGFDKSLLGFSTSILNFDMTKQDKDAGFYYEGGNVYVASDIRFELRKITQNLVGKTAPLWSLCLLSMLNANGVEQKIHVAPKNLNKRRVAAGKPPIGEVREILINVGGKRYLPSGEAERGSHASPRLHWRRGHIRRLPSGEITHVRPHLVGAAAGGAVPAKKDYRVKAAGA